MNDAILVTDIHGCFYTLTRLLNTCAAQYPGARLYLLGDLIDRGPHSRAVVEFAMGNRVTTCSGNHEDLALAYSAHVKRGYKAHCAGYYERDIWLYNGGIDTLVNWQKDEAKWAQAVPDNVLDWFQSLPAYLLPDLPADDTGRRLLVSHTGYGLNADTGHWFSALWGRHAYGGGEFPDDGLFRVYGHTQQSTPDITPTRAMIDTGCAYKGMGVLTALHWPSKAVVQQAFDESSAKAHFTIRDGCIFGD